MNYWNKNKRAGGGTQKRNNWNQSLRSSANTSKSKRIRKSLQYILLLKKFDNVIDYTNLKLLEAFLTKYGKIRSRRKHVLVSNNRDAYQKQLEELAQQV